MFDFKQIEIWQIFVLVCFFTFLYKIEEVIEDESYKDKSKSILSVLIITSTFVSAIVGTIIWFTLEELKLSFTVLGKNIVFQGGINVFISITIPFFFKEMIALVKRKISYVAVKGE